MQTKSKGKKPLSTGNYKTRRELNKAVVKLYDSTRLSQEKVGEACGVGQTIVFNILEQRDDDRRMKELKK